MMSHRILPAALLLCTLSTGCAELPTRNDTHAQPDGPAYEGGYTMGSGNSATQSSGYTSGSGSTAEDVDSFAIGVENSGAGSTDQASSTSTSSEDGTGRSGYTMGSGN